MKKNGGIGDIKNYKYNNKEIKMGFKDFLSEQKEVSKQLIEGQKKREKLKEHISELKQQMYLLEKAVSKSQQEDVEDFASTEHDGLPKEIKEVKRGGGKKGKQGSKHRTITGKPPKVNRPPTPPPPRTHKTPKKPSRAEIKNADKKEIRKY